jgi:hypothetical protein
MGKVKLGEGARGRESSEVGLGCVMRLCRRTNVEHTDGAWLGQILDGGSGLEAETRGVTRGPETWDGKESRGG